MKNGDGFCPFHGICKRYSYLDCNSMAQKKSVCMRRGYKKKTCSMHGCNNNAMRNGVCISHGPKCSCMIKECNQAIFQEKKCHFHYGCSLCNSVFDWDPTITRIMDMLSFGTTKRRLCGIVLFNLDTFFNNVFSGP
jgi:hypothetical protein